MITVSIVGRVAGGWSRLEANAGLLTNCEALQLLQSRGADKGFGVTAAECKVFILFFSLFENRVSTLGVCPSFVPSQILFFPR